MSPARTPRRLGLVVGLIAVLSRSISDGTTFFGWFRPLSPVRKIAARSLRGVAGALMP